MTSNYEATKIKVCGGLVFLLVCFKKLIEILWEIFLQYGGFVCLGKSFSRAVEGKHVDYYSSKGLCTPGCILRALKFFSQRSVVHSAIHISLCGLICVRN